MTNLLRYLRRPEQERWQTLTTNELGYWMNQFSYQGLGYGPGIIQTMQQNREEIQRDFEGFITGAYKSSGPIFALIMTRMFVFSQARFQFRRMQSNGRPGKLFGTQDLAVLEDPDVNVTTGDMLARALLDVDLAGNWFARTVVDPKRPAGKRIVRLRPDWMTILKGSVDQSNISPYDPTAELVGYLYHPGGQQSGLAPQALLPEEVAHFAPLPDPAANYRGMSWIQPVMQEIMGDKAMSQHKLMFFENGASPNLVISMDTGKMNRETFQEWVDAFEQQHQGSLNAYKSLYLGQGATATVVGANLRELEYHSVMGQGETRLAAASGVPPMLAGFSEGLQALTYQNFQMARRLFADRTLRWLWQNMSGSLANLINVPGGSRLWYDDRDISFLQDDALDQANIQLTKSTAMRLLVDAGYEPDSIVTSIESNDMTQLKHSGLYSVQLQEPGSKQPGIDNPDQPDQPDQPDTPAGSNSQGNGGSDTLASADRRAILLHGANGHPEALAKALLAAKAGD